jgi:hypothetical protein
MTVTLELPPRILAVGDSQMNVLDLIKEYGALREAKRREEANKVLAEIEFRLFGTKATEEDSSQRNYSIPRCPICGMDWRHCGHPIEG